MTSEGPCDVTFAPIGELRTLEGDFLSTPEVRALSCARSTPHSTVALRRWLVGRKTPQASGARRRLSANRDVGSDYIIEVRVVARMWNHSKRDTSVMQQETLQQTHRNRNAIRFLNQRVKVDDVATYDRDTFTASAGEYCKNRFADRDPSAEASSMC